MDTIAGMKDRSRTLRARSAVRTALPWAWAVFFAIAGAARADTVLLTNGSEITGTVVQEDDEGLTVKVPGGHLRLSRSQVASVRWDDPAGRATRKAQTLWDRGFYKKAAVRLRKAFQSLGPNRRIEEALQSRVSARAETLLRQGRIEETRSFVSIAAGLPGWDRGPGARLGARCNRDEARLRLALASPGIRASELFPALRAWPSRSKEFFARIGRLYTEQGRNLARQGRFEEGEILLRRALAYDPRLAPSMQKGVADILRASLCLGRTWPTSVSLRSWTNLYPADAGLWLFLGIRLVREGRPKEAAKAFDRIEGFPRFPDPEALAGLLASPARLATQFPRIARPPKWPRGLPTLWVHAPPTDQARLASVVRHHLLRLASRFGVAHESLPTALHVRVLADESDPLPAWAGGKCTFAHDDDGLPKVFIVARRTSPQLQSGVLPHELGHVVFRGITGYDADLPLWLDEGAALWSETMTRRSHMELLLGHFLAREQVIPFSAFLKADEKDLGTDPKRIDLFYAQAFGLFTFFMSRHTPRAFGNLLVHGRAVFLSALPGAGGASTIARLEQAWTAWARKRFPSPWKVDAEKRDAPGGK
jgi:tetratricopeptide (TPR) repeat protein